MRVRNQGGKDSNYGQEYEISKLKATTRSNVFRIIYTGSETKNDPGRKAAKEPKGM